MRFAIEAGSWTNPRGYGRFLRSLHGALLRRGRHEWVLVLDDETQKTAHLADSIPRHIVATGYAAARGAAIHHHRSLGEMWRMSRGISRGRFDAVLFPSPHTYVPALGAPEILIVHDVTAERFPDLVFENAAAARRWRWKMRLAIGRARRVMSVSEHSARGLVEIYGLDPAKVAVAPEAPDTVFFEKSTPWVRETPYVLFVGGLSPHKNLGVLLEALVRVPGVDLLLAGPFRNDLFHAGDLTASIQRLGLVDRVVTVSDPDDARLRDIYAGALALVLPSFDEGFGLPAVEAAAAGTPVILSRTTAATEFLGDAALLFDPEEAGELAPLLEWVRDKPEERRALGERGREKVRALDWDRTAEVVEATVEEAVTA
jgi:glycosyltransferase involved in cell wall biosynthesis